MGDDFATKENLMRGMAKTTGLAALIGAGACMLAATVCPTSIALSITNPSMGERITVRSRSMRALWRAASRWSSVASAVSTCASAIARSASALV
jgi:hypothetical protein